MPKLKQYNANLFSAMGNNPVNYVDPDGEFIFPAYWDDTDFEKDFNNAYNRLEQSATNSIVRAVLWSLKNDSKYSITVSSAKENGYNNSTKSIGWNRYERPYNKSNGLYNSAAVGLFHELVHAWVDNTDEGKKIALKFISDNKKNMDIAYDTLDLSTELSRKEFYLEEFATAMEVLAALDLNEKPSRKWYYEITGSEYVLTVTNIFQHGMVK